MADSKANPATELTAFGMTYEEAWKQGYFTYDPSDGEIGWTPRLFRDFYRPTVAQHVLLNSCWSMLPYDRGWLRQDGVWTWAQDTGANTRLYNFGDALMSTAGSADGPGVKVVFGPVEKSHGEAVVQFTVPFFRRMFGGYFSGDLPPAPHNFWPTCMGTQTYFRLRSRPFDAVYANKIFQNNVVQSAEYTMYAVPENRLFRAACPGYIPDAYMQDFMLTVGTPATEPQHCWDTWWGSGQYPNPQQDPFCTLGDNPATQSGTIDAACAVKVARQVTNAMLTTQ
jgi:hypothetical protein